MYAGAGSESEWVCKLLQVALRWRFSFPLVQGGPRRLLSIYCSWLALGRSYPAVASASPNTQILSACIGNTASLLDRFLSGRDTPRGSMVYCSVRTRGSRFDSRVVLLFHWVATLGKLFTHIACPVSQLQETGIGYKREFFSASKWLWWLSALD